MESLRSLRRSRALTFLDLAALSAIPARTIAEAEYGMRRLSAAEREQLAFVLGLNPTDLNGSATQIIAVARRNGLTPQLLIAAALVATLAGSTLAELPLNPPRLNLNPLTRTVPQAPPRMPEPRAEASVADLRIAPLAAEGARIRRETLNAIMDAHQAGEPLAPRLLHGPPPRPAPAPAPAFVLSERGPLGCPVQPGNGKVVLTQGYGVGSHAPAHVWGAVDLAVDADGDGYAEPGSSWYAPIVASHDGHVRVTLNSYPAGHHVWVNEPGGVWRSGYAHLALVLVASGQFVRAGEVIGLMGSSGMASGPHLDYQVWQGDRNIDPTPLVGCGIS